MSFHASALRAWKGREPAVSNGLQLSVPARGLPGPGIGHLTPFQHIYVKDQTFRRTLVTSALPYANGYLHLGHVAGAYLPADMYTRFLRACGEDVIHVSGSDENGVPITISADEEGVSPQEIADKYHTDNEQAFAGLGIDFDVYGRTSWKLHHETAQEFFLTLWNAGLFVEKETQQFFDPQANKFLPDRYVEGTCPNCGFDRARGDQCDNCSATYDQTELINPVSKLSGGTPVLRTTKHAYLKLGEFQNRLEAFVESHRADWRDHVLQQARSWLKAGLGDRAMTRDLEWGIPVPVEGYEHKKLYVWFDAPFGYITNTKALYQAQGEPEGWRRWWQSPDTRYVPFIGKDNIVFHTLIFPATLMGFNDYARRNAEEGVEPEQYIIPDNVPACEFLNLEGRKFSKSNNWGIDLRDYLAEYDPDPLRYVLAANMPENKDADFTWREYQARVNNELADILGNFVNRTATFVLRYFNGEVPPLVVSDKEDMVRQLLSEDLQHFAETNAPRDIILSVLRPKFMKYFSETDLGMLLELAQAPERIAEKYRMFRFREAVLETMNLARAANKYFNDSEPWKTRKDDPERCGTTLNICLQVVRSLAILFEPILPFTSAKMLDLLNLTNDDKGNWWSAAKLHLRSGNSLNEPAILFNKFEDETVEKEVAKLGAGKPRVAANRNTIDVQLKPEISIEDVMKLDLRVATIVAAEKVKKSNKLLRLELRIGTLKRQIVAGVAKGYSPEELVGKKIVVVANLKPAKLMGVESQGMLLAANEPEGNQPPILLTLMGDDELGEDGFEVR